jgi:hypothetical protein
MTEILKPKAPYKFEWDGDPIAYAGSASAQKIMYCWEQFSETDFNLDEGVMTVLDGAIPISKSPDFNKAVEAKQWIETECWEDEPDVCGWRRKAYTVFRELQDAINATDEVVKDYFATEKKFCRKGKTPIRRAWLTPSGEKLKNSTNLEDQYQFNRIGKEKPKFLPDCRAHLLKKYPFFRMARLGWEADTHVVGRAEMFGEDGCTLSIDKDIEQGEETWHVNTYGKLRDRKIKYATSLGSLWNDPNFRGKDKTRGDGFMFLCYQTIVGDVSDGYKGLYGVGDKAAVKILQNCKTKTECVEAMEILYIKKSKKGYICKKMKELKIDSPDSTKFNPVVGEFRFISWVGKLEVRTVHQMMQQHFELAYQERNPNDVFDINDYLKTSVRVGLPLQPLHPNVVKMKNKAIEDAKPHHE